MGMSQFFQTNLLNALAGFALYLGICLLVMLIFGIIGRCLAWLIWRVAVQRRRFIRSRNDEKRVKTLRSLLRSFMDGLAVLFAVVFTLSLAVPATTLTTALGLFSAGIGFAARPFISDFLAGVQFLLQNQFSIGEKVEIGDKQVVGTIEQITLTQTYLRGESGELWIVPNGDVRTIRNFSRGSFSPANVRLTIPTSRLSDGMEVLELAIADVSSDVVERPEIISEAGEIGETTTLTLVLKARFGKAPEVRRRALTRLHHELAAREIINRVQVETNSHGPPDSAELR